MDRNRQFLHGPQLDSTWGRDEVFSWCYTPVRIPGATSGAVWLRGPRCGGTRGEAQARYKREMRHEAPRPVRPNGAWRRYRS